MTAAARVRFERTGRRHVDAMVGDRRVALLFTIAGDRWYASRSGADDSGPFAGVNAAKRWVREHAAELVAAAAELGGGAP